MEQDRKQEFTKKEKKKIKVEFVAASSFFYKGVQVHAGSKVGYTEDLFKQGLIQKKVD